MAYGIIRVRTLSAGDISSTDKHNARRYETSQEYPLNIDSEGTSYERYETEKTAEYLTKEETTLQEVIDARLKDNNVKGIRKNSNLAIEYVCAINDKKAWKDYSFSGFVSNTKTWLEDRHGKNSVVATYEHLDESNPHVHFVIMPLKTKKVKWKNQRGSGERTETRLNTREFVNGRDVLRGLQDDWHNHLCKRYDNGKKMGIEFFRGTLAEFQYEAYSKQTNHEIGLLRNEISLAKTEVAKANLQLQIAQKQARLLEEEKDFEQEKKQHNEKAKKNWKIRGTGGLNQPFHHEKEKKKGKGRSI